MTGFRYVDETRLLDRVAGDSGRMENFEALRRWLRRQPRLPALISAQEAGRIIQVHPPHLARLRESGRLTEVPVEGGHPVFLLPEVKEVAREVARARRQRARRRAAA